ncbi:cysteine hydrolase family protein [Duganella violaceipulchra]|uniref:Cysteine hydrolase n=1 Tax=Duganella violaceipulchra TaxID=2849652 RepID=A0AA41L446_9BURK|nr:isochorismatase family cysteine hydrolase [Duganella violaceicalia]MBV6322494.1 cysteine hydrolase [Duganella violaceicalia]MCP2010704.1 nicotinamidase-related amidase [Duganella violaceicalia]
MKPSSSLFLTIDFINDIVHRDGKIASCAAMVAGHGVLERCNQALAWARAQGMLVAHVKVGFPASYANCPERSPIFGQAARHGALQLDTWGTYFHDALDVRADELVIVKPRVGAFYNTELESLLRAQRIGHLILAGVSTCHAIESTAREAHDRDYGVTVLADCCASASVERHERTLSGALASVADVRTLDVLRAVPC